MCGIAGIVSRRNNVATPLDRMVEAISHRGPNSRGIRVFDVGGWTVGLGQARLSIIDLSSAGDQPMPDRSGNAWITYNGEIYNFPRIKADLPDIPWKSHSDTETILEGYAHWGAEVTGRLRGMFALGLLDTVKRELTLARDTFGIKPLYFFACPDYLVFASEVRALLASGLVPKRLSRAGLESYLAYGSVQDPLTLVEGVRALRPGHTLNLALGGDSLTIAEKPFSTRKLVEHLPRVQSRGEAIAVLRELLEESIELHLISDVPTGAFLSGGIDSSAVVALMNAVGAESPRTFSISFTEKAFDEGAYAALVSERFGCRHTEIRLAERDLLRHLPDALNALDQPTMDGINSYFVSKAVKEAGITVALSGLGGDELFAGYPSFRRARVTRWLTTVPQPIRRAASAVGATVLNDSVQSRKMWDLLRGDGHPRQVYDISRRLFSDAEIERLLGGRPTGPVLPDEASDAETDPINLVSRLELRGYMANTLLRDTDFMSMAHALEVRVPFVDVVVAEFVLSLPGEWKMDSTRNKPLLLDALSGLLPSEVWNRPKMGFTFPFERWLRSSLREWVSESLADSVAPLGLDSRFVRTISNDFQINPKKERWSRPWALFVLGAWCRRNGVVSG